MRYFVKIKSNDVILREDKEGSSDLYHAYGRASMLASSLAGAGAKMANMPLAIEVINCGGEIVFSLPVNSKAQSTR